MRVITREEWGSKYGRGNPTSGAKTEFVVHHDGIDRSYPSTTQAKEAEIVRMFERFHANDLTKSNPRIAYSFVIMQSGRIYEGCGWERIGAHTAGLNSSAYAACFPVNGGNTALTSDALAALTWLRAEGVRLGHLTQHHRLSGHQDHGKMSCPGKLVYDAAVRGLCATDEYPTINEVIAARPSLRRGSMGPAVAELQRLLGMSDLLPDTFGPQTETVVIKFQRENGLVTDGVIGTKSWNVLLAKAGI